MFDDNVRYAEPTFIAYLKGKEGAAFLHNSHVTFSKSDSRVPSNTSSKLWSSSLYFGAGGKQWHDSPAVAKQKETQVKLFSEGKANGDVRQP